MQDTLKKGIDIKKYDLNNKIISHLFIITFIIKHYILFGMI